MDKDLGWKKVLPRQFSKFSHQLYVPAAWMIVPRFFALLIQGIPRSVRIEPDLKSIGQADLLPLELDAVSLDGEIAKIPDLAALEQKLADLNLI